MRSSFVVFAAALPSLAACRVQPLGLQCVASDVSYTLTLPNGNARSGDLGCRMALQAASPRKSLRRLLLRLDSGSVSTGVAADTGGADTGTTDSGAADTGDATSADWSGDDGVVIGIAWSGWDKRLHHNLDIEPWAWPVPDNEASFGGVAESFGYSREPAETAVIAAFFTPEGATEQREFKSDFEGGWVQATRYVYQKKSGSNAFLQLVIEDLVLEDGAVLDLEGDLSFTGEELVLPEQSGQ